MKFDALILNPNDSVAVALHDISKGSRVELSNGSALIALDDIPTGHKILLTSLLPGAAIKKYGEIIGHARAGLLAGQWVHVEHFATEEEEV
jgi:altronate hydrolase